LVAVWDGLGAQHSRQTKIHLAKQKSWLEVARLPACAPELNPVEYLWNYLKAGSANYCADDLSAVTAEAKRRLRRVRATDLTWSFLKHSGLYPSLHY
jgi:transposase